MNTNRLKEMTASQILSEHAQLVKMGELEEAVEIAQYLQKCINSMHDQLEAQLN